VDRTTITKWESGRHAPALADLQGLVTTFRKARLLQNARQAYRLAWFLRYEKWYSEQGIQAMLLQVFGELEEDWEALQRLYWQAPRLSPAHYVARPDLLASLKEALFDDEGPTAIGLWGMAGIGKTTLLKALGQEPEIWGHFDFILWAEIGPTFGESGVEAQLHQWTHLLELPATEPPTIKSLTRTLRERLAPDRSLLLLDDVWDGEAIRPLLISSPKGRAVVTTRNRAVVEGLEVGAKLVAVSPMALNEAHQLVENVSGQGISSGEEADFGAIHHLLEGLPLAINLVAPWIGDKGCGWTLRSLERKALRLPLLEREGRPSRSGSVRVAFALSYEQLEAQGRPDLQARFRSLGVLATAPFCAEAASAIWGSSDVHEAEEALSRLCRLSLIHREEAASRTFRFRLHRLLHDLARELLEELGEEMDQSIERYIQHQITVAEALNYGFSSGNEPGNILQEFSRELPHLDRAFGYALERGDADALGRLLYHGSSLLLVQGNHNQLDRWLDQAERWLAEHDLEADEALRLSAHCHLHRGRLSLERENSQAGVDQMTAALGRGLGNPASEALALASLAVAYQAQGDLTAADSALFQAEMKETVVPDSWLKCQLLSLRADLARDRGESFQAVLDLHEEALQCFQVYGNRVDEIKERARLVDFYLATDEWQRALTAAQRAFEQAGQSGLLEMGYDIAVCMALEAFDREEQETAKEWLLRVEGVVAQLTKRQGADRVDKTHPPEIVEQQEWEGLLASLEAATRLWSEMGDRRRLGRTQELRTNVSIL
jgi:tetratricopeptide (TPR) repeat protein